MIEVRVRKADPGVDEFGRPFKRPEISTDSLLASVADSDAKRFFGAYLSVKAGLRSDNSKAKELARLEDLNAGTVFRYFQKRNALSVHDLPDVVGAVLVKVTIPSYLPTHRKICKFTKAENFFPHEFLATLYEAQVAEVLDGGEVPVTVPSGLVTSAQIRTKRLRIPLSREIIFHSTLNFTDLPGLMLRAAFRAEATETYAVLEGNPNLSDGSPLFGTGNSVVDANLSIEAALTAFRDQVSAAGEELHLEPKYYVVPSGTEFSARKDIKDAGLDIEVVSTKSISNAYLLADPEQSPVLVRLALSENPVIESVKPPFESNAAVVLDLFNDYLVKPISREGACRVTAA